MTEGDNQKEASLDEQDIAREEPRSKIGVERKLAFSMFPTKEQVAEVLRCYCGSPYKIIQHLINTHKSSGEIPSHEEGCINMHPIVSKHYKVIVSMRELSAEVRRGHPLWIL